MQNVTCQFPGFSSSQGMQQASGLPHLEDPMLQKPLETVMELQQARGWLLQKKAALTSMKQN
jgi:hypothetical protein